VSARAAGTYGRRAGRAPSRRGAVRRRRILAILAAALAGGLVAMAVLPVDKVVQEVTLPLRHEDVIRQQAADKSLDPALIAGVIYTESRFRDQTSHAGARGLMQITPQTADYIARKSGGTRFEQGDLATPQINIAYGTYHLRWLLDRYRENEVLALAAYNGGEGNVDRWIERARAQDKPFVVEEIPFPETREYVTKVQTAKQQYRETYARELGIG
jgi:soluble lytic murein transglycosylase